MRQAIRTLCSHKVLLSILCACIWAMCFHTHVSAQTNRVWPIGVAWNSDSTLLAVALWDGNLQLLDGNTYQVLNTFPLAQSGFNTISKIDWNPVNPHLLAVAGGDLGNGRSMVTVLDVHHGSFAFTFSGVQAIRSVRWNPDGARLAFSVDYLGDNFGNRTTQVWDTVSNELLLRISTGSDTITSVAWSPDGNRLGGASINSQVYIWDGSTGETVATLSGHTAIVRAIAWSPDGMRIAMSSELTDKTVRIWNVDKGETEQIIPDVYTSQLAWSRDGRQLAVVNVVHSIDIFAPMSGQLIDTFPEGAFADSLAYSTYGGRLAFAGQINPSVGLTHDGNANAQTIADGAVQIVVPAPSLERLQAITAACDAPASVVELLPGSAQAEPLRRFITQVDGLPDNTIPPACAADLIAVAEALQSQ